MTKSGLWKFSLFKISVSQYAKWFLWDTIVPLFHSVWKLELSAKLLMQVN